MIITISIKRWILLWIFQKNTSSDRTNKFYRNLLNDLSHYNLIILSRVNIVLIMLAGIGITSGSWNV